jgi:hypothetical protein
MVSLVMRDGQSGDERYTTSVLFPHRCMYSVQLYVIKFVSGFTSGTFVSSTNKTDHHDITEVLLKVALNTINQPTNYIITSLMHL